MGIPFLFFKIIITQCEASWIDVKPDRFSVQKKMDYAEKSNIQSAHFEHKSENQQHFL